MRPCTIRWVLGLAVVAGAGACRTGPYWGDGAGDPAGPKASSGPNGSNPGATDADGGMLGGHPTAAPTLLASDPDGIVSIAIGGANVFFSTGYHGSLPGLLKTVPVGGGPMTTFASPGGPLVVDSANVYWTTPSDGAMTCPLRGCAGAPTHLGSGTGPIAVDRTYIYAGTFDGQGIVRTPLAGGDGGTTPAMLGSGGDGVASNIAVDGASVFWVARDNLGLFDVMKIPLSGWGGQPTRISPDGGGRGEYLWAGSLAVVGPNVFYAGEKLAGGGGVLRLPAASNGDTPPTVIFNVVDFRSAPIACDGTNVYWFDQDWQTPSQVQASLLTCRVSGCTGFPTVLVQGTSGVAIATDAANVYWSTPAGVRVGSYDAAPSVSQLLSVPKPR